jgi:ribosome-binding protein aMBF1 (putative translation factor)
MKVSEVRPQLKVKMKTTDAVKALRRKYVDGDPEMERLVADYGCQLRIAQRLYEMRHERGLTQKQLAAKVGTTPSVISRLEDADYDGKQSLKMLQRIAHALDYELTIDIQPVDDSKRPATDRRAFAAIGV